jgi:negative regulator of sigma E activity
LSTHLGATHTMMRAHGERWWITVMGDVPMATLKVIADALVRKP